LWYNSGMHKKYIATIVALLAISAPAVLNAQMPYGGMVTATIPCNSGGMLLYVLQPMRGITLLMWNAGELPFLMYASPHPAQNMIGEYAPATIPCVVGTATVGSGFPIIFHGESN